MKAKLFFLTITTLSFFCFGQQKNNKVKKITLHKPVEILCFRPYLPLKPLPYIIKNFKFQRILTSEEYNNLTSEELSKYKNDSTALEVEKLTNILEEKRIAQIHIDYNKDLTTYNEDMLKYNKCLAYNNNLNKSGSGKIIDEYEDYYSENVITGNLGCSNVVPKYDNSFDTSLLVKNHGDLDMVLKLIDLENNIAIRMVYIKKNSTFEITHIPQGRYMMKEAHGANWKQKTSDDKCIGIFTENAIYKKSKNIADFNITKSIKGDIITTHIPSYELELGIKIARKPGTTKNSSYQTNTISSSQFNE